MVLFEYLPGIEGWYFADDFNCFFPRPEKQFTHGFVLENPNHPYFFRPIEWTLLAWQQALTGATRVSHFIAISLHIILALLTFTLARRYTQENLDAALASLFCAGAQIAAQSVAGVDTLSQVGSTLCFYGSAMLLFRATEGLASIPSLASWNLWMSVLVALAAALWKESGFASFIAAILFLFMVATREKSVTPGRRFTTASLTAVPYILAALIYLGIRSQFVTAGPAIERYTLAPDYRIFMNAALLLGSIVVPSPPHHVLVAANNHAFGYLTLAALWALVFVGFAACGYLRRARRPTSSLLILLALALLPALPLGHVNEVYAYGGLPAAAVLIGLGLGNAIRSIMQTRSLLIIIPSAMLILGTFAGSAVFARQKVILMARNGATSKRLYHDLRSRIEALPHGTRIEIVDRSASLPRYSVLILSDFHTVSDSFRHLAEDLQVEGIEVRQECTWRSEEPTRCFQFRDGAFTEAISPD